MDLGFLGVFFDFSVIGVIRILLFCIVGILIGILVGQYGTGKNRILYIRERDGRGQRLTIKSEDAMSLETVSKPPLRFFKYGRAYEFMGRMKTKLTTFFGKEGTAYTWSLWGFNQAPVEWMEEEYEEEISTVLGSTKKFKKKRWIPKEHTPVGFQCEFQTLEDAVKFRWGEHFYRTVPDTQKELLQNDKVLMTVELEAGLTPEGYQPITEQDIDDEGDRNMLALLAAEAKGVIKTPIINYLFAIGTGGAIVLMVSLFFGWIQLRPV